MGAKRGRRNTRGQRGDTWNGKCSVRVSWVVSVVGDVSTASTVSWFLSLIQDAASTFNSNHST